MDFKQRTLDFLEQEWGTYIERFKRLPVDEGVKRVQEQGYERFRDLLAHIVAWWEEGMGIILAIAEGREYARKKYDFDVFNAEAVAKFKDWDETGFLAYFEATRKKTLADLKTMNTAAWENPRVQAWVNGIFIHHAREHLVVLSRFLALDMLQNCWATYIEDFEKITDKHVFFKKQGFENLHDLLAHIIGWWDEGARVIRGMLSEPGFKWEEQDVDRFNSELVKKYADWSDADILKLYETTRAALVELVNAIPEDAFWHSDIQSWLAADVIEHYDGHHPSG
jgi:hypothetical protein